MALNFGGSIFDSDNNLTNISGVQFSQEAENTKVIHYVSAAAAAYETVYTVPAGKNLFIGKIMIANTGIQIQKFIKIGGNVIVKQIVDAATTFIWDFAIPFLVTAGQEIEVQMNQVGATITIIGWEA